MTRSARLHKVVFLSHGRSIELYARHVAGSALWGFVEVGELVFTPPAPGRLVDPGEERLREEFKDTTLLHLPLHAIVRIEEVSRRGTPAIHEVAGGDKIMPFPLVPPRER